MQSVSTLFSKKTLSVGLLMLLVIFTKAHIVSVFDAKKIFWNKFEASITNDNMVVLTWNVTEYSNKSFLVQHSMNGSDWKDIAVVPSQNSAESMTDYSYTYKNNHSGKQFYRLRDIDRDNKSKSISPIISLLVEKNAQHVTIWPNPATTHITIANNNTKGDIYTRVRVFDMAGTMMIESTLNPDITEIAVNHLLPGIYIVKIEGSKGAGSMQKFVKQ